MTSYAYLIPGRMPLWLAWALAWSLVPFALAGIANIAANTPVDQPLYVGLLAGSLITAPVAAWRKGRRWWLWLLIGLGGLVATAFGLGALFQPITVAVAAVLAERASADRKGSPAVHPPEHGGRIPTQHVGEANGISLNATGDAPPAQDEQAPVRRSASRKPFRGRRRQRR